MTRLSHAVAHLRLAPRDAGALAAVDAAGERAGRYPPLADRVAHWTDRLTGALSDLDAALWPRPSDTSREADVLRVAYDAERFDVLRAVAPPPHETLLACAQLGLRIVLGALDGLRERAAARGRGDLVAQIGAELAPQGWADPLDLLNVINTQPAWDLLLPSFRIKYGCFSLGCEDGCVCTPPMPLWLVLECLADPTAAERSTWPPYGYDDLTPHNEPLPF